MAQGLNLLYCYAPEDRLWAEKIDAHLQELKSQCRITSRFDGELTPEYAEKERLLKLLEGIDLAIVVVSSYFQPVSFLWTDTCMTSFDVRIPGRCRVVAVITEPVMLEYPLFGVTEILPRESMPAGSERTRDRRGSSMHMVPEDVKPLSIWSDQEQAFQSIERWLRVAIEKHWVTKGHFLDREGLGMQAEEALSAYDEALRLNPLIKDAWYGKARILIGHKSYEKTLGKEHREQLAKKRADASEISAFDEPRCYEEALHASEQALWLDSSYTLALVTKAGALAGLKRYEEALQIYDRALLEEPRRGGKYWHAGIWHDKSSLFKAMGRKRKARRAAETARQLGWRW